MSRQPVFLATNDYSLVLQTILALGGPSEHGGVSDRGGDRDRSDLNHGITGHPRPTLVGQYGVGNTVGVFAGDVTGGFDSKDVQIQILDVNGNVLGQAPVNNANGDYLVKFAQPLQPGNYIVRARAVDPEGHMSEPSPAYALKVIPRQQTAIVTSASTPQGPLGQHNS